MTAAHHSKATGCMTKAHTCLYTSSFLTKCSCSVLQLYIVQYAMLSYLHRHKLLPWTWSRSQPFGMRLHPAQLDTSAPLATTLLSHCCCCHNQICLGFMQHIWPDNSEWQNKLWLQMPQQAFVLLINQKLKKIPLTDCNATARSF